MTAGRTANPIAPGLGADDVRGLFSGLTDAFIFADHERRIVWVNEAFTDILGYTLQDIRGKKTQVLYEVGDDYAVQGRERVNEDSSPLKSHYRVNYRHKNGRVLRSDTVGWAVRDADGRVKGFAAIIRDIGSDLGLRDVLKRLYGISSSQQLSGTEKIHEIIRMGCEHFRLPTGIVSIVTGDKATVLYSMSTVSELLPGTQFDLCQTFCNETVKADVPFAIANVVAEDQDSHPHFTQRGARAYIGVPLIVDGVRFGTLSFASPVPHIGFTSEDIDLIRLFAAWIAQELGLEKSYRKLSEAASTDWLTQASTRQMFQSEAESAFSEYMSMGHTSGLIMIDIDHFKEINDTHGHAAGDCVLREVAERVKAQLPLGFPLYRLGGEEFAVLLRNTYPEETEALAEHLRRVIDQSEFDIKGRTIRVTASFGTSNLNARVQNEAAWLRRADTALYASKQNGRNRVTAAGQDNVFDFMGSGESHSVA